MMWTKFLEQETSSYSNEAEFMNELYRKMFIVAYSKVHNKVDALDIVQESWIKIIEKVDSLKDVDKFVQWAKAIVANTAVNVIKRQRYLGGVVHYDFDQLLSDGQLVDIEIEGRFLRDILFGGIVQLDEQTRTIFIRKFYYNWGDRQIAEELDIPLGTVKSRIHRGKERLRSLLSKALEPHYIA